MKTFLGVLALLLMGGGSIVAGIVALAPVPSPASGKVLILGAEDSGALLESLPSYATLEEAGVHAIEKAYACSHYYECGGPIAQKPDGRYVVGPVRSDASGDSVGMSHTVPAGWKLVADYHTHPCLADTHYVDFFSPQDLSNSFSSKIIGFMGSLCDGNVHEFDPSRDSPNDVKVDDDIYLTHGRIIGKISVDGKSVQPVTGL